MKILDIDFTILGLTGLFIFIIFLGIISWAHLRFLEDYRVMQANLGFRLGNIEADLDAVKNQTMLFWKEVATYATRILHSPHTPVLDELIEQFEAGDITDLAAKQLIHILEEVVLATETEGPFRCRVAKGLLYEVQQSLETRQRRQK